MATDSMRQISHKVQLIGHLNNSVNIVRLSQFLKYSSYGFLVYAFDSSGCESNLQSSSCTKPWHMSILSI